MMAKSEIVAAQCRADLLTVSDRGAWTSTFGCSRENPEIMTHEYISRC